MSQLSHSVKFSEQPYSQNEKFQVYVPDLDEAANMHNGSIQQGNNSRVHNFKEEDQQANNQNTVVNNNSSSQPGASQIYSPHYAHHARLQLQNDIDKQFNYSGSKLRSPHHNPQSKIQSKLRSNLYLDQQYNQTNGQSYQNNLEGEHCTEHCPHVNSKHSLHESRNELPKDSNSNKLLLYPQPYGNGAYTNQLQKRNIHAKTGNNFYNSNSSRQIYTSQESVRRSTNNNSTTFNSIMQNKRVQEKLREKLYFDERTKTVPKTTIKNGIIENIVSEGDVFMGNKQLMESIYKLKSLNLLKQHESHVNRYNGVGKFPFVFNDYHSKSTNNGYSRQEKGGYFFTR
ncbi:hypothetical protein ABPG72_010401 [Tetrahymena utriculariae]